MVPWAPDSLVNVISPQATKEPKVDVGCHIARNLDLSSHGHWKQLAIKMSVFQFGFSRHRVNVCSSSSTSVPAHMPTQEESELGVLEYMLSLSSVADHADPAN